MTHEVLYLKADSREALIAAMEAAGMWKDGYVKRYQGDEMYERGTLYAPTGKVIDGPMGLQIETAPIEGYHAELCLFGDVPESLTAIRIFPNNPQFRLGGWKSPAEIVAEEAARVEL